MDSTLLQILAYLYKVQTELDQARAIIAQMQQVIDSRLPVHEASIGDLRPTPTRAETAT